VENRCDICSVMVPMSPIDKPGDPYSLAEHKWVAHGIQGITVSEYTDEPMKTSDAVEHRWLYHTVDGDTHCDECKATLQVSLLAKHRWETHRRDSRTRCEHCGGTEKMSLFTEHLALQHDLPSPSDAQRIHREAARIRRDLLQATDRLVDGGSKIAEAVTALGEGALWIAGFAAIGYLLGASRGAAAGIALCVIIAVILRSRQSR
jgi:hypothetical protein